MKSKSLRIAQTTANCRAILEHYQLPGLEVQASLVDRTMFKVASGVNFHGLMRALNGKFAFWPFFKDHGTTANCSWRECVAFCSCQVVEHNNGLIEIDFDHGNPDFGLAPAIVHGIECLWPGKTDSFRVLRGLRKRGIAVIDVREEIHET